MTQKANIDELRRKCEAICSNDICLSSTKASSRGKALPEDTFAVNKRHTEKKSDSKPDKISNDPEKAFKKILQLLSVKDRSSCELQERLSDTFTDSACKQALQRARECFIVDDHRYADAFIRMRLREGKGIRGIEYELEKKEIAIHDVPGWPEEYCGTSDNEVNRALSLLERKPPRAKNKRDAAYRKLMQKGYSSSVASEAAQRWVNSFD